jgi:cytochrome c2
MRTAHLVALLVLLACSAHASAQCMGMGCGMMGGTFPPATDPTLLPDHDSKGAQLLQTYCAQCHGLPAPGLHTAEEWPAVVARMNNRMQHMGHMGMMGGMHHRMHGVSAPSSEERDAILAYLSAHAQKTAGEELHEALETKAGQTYRAICSQCHGLPDPKQHTQREWPAVVERMKLNARRLGKTIPDGAQTQDIVVFLRAHASAER